jgi:nitrile hydratase accessory protein
MTDVDRAIASLEGLPRRNGELVFEAPWQGRAFGMAVALTKTRHFAWDAFREVLIAEIAAHPDAAYYASWLGAFERFVVERHVVTEAEVASRTAEYVAMERDPVF